MRYQAALHPDELDCTDSLCRTESTGARLKAMADMPEPHPALPWLQPGDPFPDPEQAWNTNSPAPGLLAAGGQLDVSTLRRAYSQGIFPWFSRGQPILWWSPDPRMVLQTRAFRLHPSLRKTIRRSCLSDQIRIRMDHDFPAVIAACATSPRPGQQGTWIVESMQSAYLELHRAGLAHSVETWIDGELAGGLYCVAIRGAVFGESMFHRQSDASKIALAALVAFCLDRGIEQIDCQQNTRHLASLGAAEMPRRLFLQRVQRALVQPPVKWEFDPIYWNHLINFRPAGL
ncbi:MAG: leucyl/phenylalanyl-tRNA--protein transferase [Rhodoferax sp.]|nr:leucyl/phenylalanyl-tRNA--protein transferase [Rhodoferax sp.]